MSRKLQCQITLHCMFAVLYYRVHCSAPGTPLACLLFWATNAGVLVFGSLDKKAPVWWTCIRNTLICRQFPRNLYWNSIKEHTEVLGKVTLNVLVTLSYEPCKMKVGYESKCCCISHIFVLHSYSEYFSFCLSTTDCTLISTVKCFKENWFEGLLFLEGQTMGPGDCGYDIEKETEGCIAKHLRHWEWDCCKLRCPPQQWAPKALLREFLPSCWAELPRSRHRKPAPGRGADKWGCTQCWHKVEHNRKHLNIDRKRWVTALPHLGVNTLGFCLQNEDQHCELQEEGGAFAQENLIETHSAEIWPLQLTVSSKREQTSKLYFRALLLVSIIYDVFIILCHAFVMFKFLLYTERREMSFNK